MIRRCEPSEFEVVWEIINEGASAYKGVIPEDCWHEPYMPVEDLRREMNEGVTFWGFEQDGNIAGVMGLQSVRDVALIRHAYVRTKSQKLGIGAQLLSHLRVLTDAPVLIGTCADASWAIRFYQKHGFRMVAEDAKVRLLGLYWNIPRRQVETSVVLADPKAWKFSV